MSAAGPKVFISYRREQTAGHAGRLHDAIATRFGEAHVFMDVDLEPGIDFVQRIREAVGGSRVLLVIMGPGWATASGGDGDEPRIADPDDFVRIEVETALQRPDVTVIPLLVAGARMPDPDELPESVRPLTRRNALELSDLRWSYDVGRLSDTLDRLVGGATPAPPEREAARLPLTLGTLAAGVAVAGAAALLARWVADPIRPADQETAGGEITAATLRRTITWATVGAGLAVWLTLAQSEARRLANRLLLGLALGGLAGAVGGLVVFVPQYLPDPELSRETIRAISIGAFAVSGGFVGLLLGALWAPRSAAAGVLAGLAAGALVRLLWNASGWGGPSAFEQSLGIAGQCLLIVALVLAALQALGAVAAGGATAPAGRRRARVG